MKLSSAVSRTVLSGLAAADESPARHRRRVSRTVLSGLAAAALFVSPVAASEPGLAIVGATVFDGTAAAPVVETVLIVNGRITAVGPKVVVPKGYRVIDAKGEALLPGFFDLHTHWTGSGAPATTPMIANADLAAGVTTINDFNAAPESYEARRAWLSTLVAPHVNLCGRLSTPGGHGADWADTATTKMVSTPAGARAGVDAIAAYHADCLGEVMTDGWRYGSAPDMTSMNEDALTALVDEAHKNHIPVLTHTVTVTKGAEAGRAKVDIIAHALQDREIDDSTIAAIKAGGSALAPTLAVYEPDKGGHASPLAATDPRRVQQLAKWHYALGNTMKLYSAGVPIALGTDGGMPATLHGKAALREMELLVQAGLPASAALIAGTANSARAMGELADRGTIEVGKRADIVLIQGKPWENIGDVEKTDRVFVDGKLLFGPGAPPLNADAPMPAVKVAALVDDFEGKDGRSNLNTLVVTNPDGGLDRSTEIIQIVPRESGHALMMTAKMAAKDNATASVVIPLTKGSVAPADLTGYHGVRFELRGDGEYRVSLKGLKGVWTSAPVVGGEGWQTVEVPFASLKMAGQKGAAAVWAGNDLTEIEIVDHRGAGVVSWLEIDTVVLY